MFAESLDKNAFIKFLKENKIKLILTLLFFANFLFLVLWLYLDTRPPSWDPATHLTSTVIYYYLLISRNLNPIVWLKVDNYYPPFYHISAVPLFAIFKNSDGATLINFVYFVILVFSVFRITKEITKDDELALYSTIFVSLFVPLLRMELMFMLDLALTSLTTLSIYFLIKSNYFTDVKYSTLFGLAFGLSLLTKWTAFIFILPPTTYIFVKKIIKDKKDILKDKSFLKSVGCAIAMLLIVAGPWYFVNFNEVYYKLKFFGWQMGAIEGNPRTFSEASVVYYINTAFKGLGVFFIAFLPIFLYILYMCFTKRKEIKDYDYILALLVCIIVSYIILTFFMRNKDPRYILPLYPTFAIFISAGLQKIKKLNLRRLAVTILGTIGIVQCFLHLPRPINEHWPIKEVIHTIASDIQKHPALAWNGVVIGVVQDHKYINGRTFQYYALQEGYNFYVINLAYVPSILYMNNQKLNEFFKAFDYLIWKTGEYNTPWKDVVKKAEEWFLKNKNKYVIVKSFKLPDNSSLIIYRRK